MNDNYSGQVVRKIDDRQIDIVYLWVDGSDPVWQKKRQATLEKLASLDDLAIYGDVAGRYRDNDELRFNLRALEKFFPSHGHIYIVTDAQTPHWLKPHESLTLIDHAELIPKGLPVFDSGHIESYLHHIPNLSERFIYLNDDVFFCQPVTTDLWFGEQGVALFLDAYQLPDYEEMQVGETALVNASVLSNKWLSAYDTNYQHTHQIFAHAPRPMFKSVLQQLESLAHELFDCSRQTTFRTWNAPPIVPDFVPRWLLHQGMAKILPLQYLYISTCDAEAPNQFEQLLEQFGRIPFFCINDTCDDIENNAPSLQCIKTVLEQLLPVASSFES